MMIQNPFPILRDGEDDIVAVGAADADLVWEG
jgi:hypothetical protein